MTPELSLVAAILQRAFDDMFAASPSSYSGNGGTPDGSSIDQAIRFLTDTHGHKARWRNHYCSLLGLDGDAVADRIRRMLDGDLPMQMDQGPWTRAGAIRRHEAGVEQARERWRHLKNPPSTPRTSVVSA